MPCARSSARRSRTTTSRSAPPAARSRSTRRSTPRPRLGLTCPPIGMHAGINTGIVIAGTVGDGSQFGVMGDTINTASRLMNLAQRGEIFVSAETATAAAPRLPPGRPRRVRGEGQRAAGRRVQRRRASWTPDERGRRRPVCARRSSDAATELAQLQALADETRRRRRHVGRAGRRARRRQVAARRRAHRRERGERCGSIQRLGPGRGRSAARPPDRGVRVASSPSSRRAPTATWSARCCAAASRCRPTSSSRLPGCCASAAATAAAADRARRRRVRRSRLARAAARSCRDRRTGRSRCCGSSSPGRPRRASTPRPTATTSSITMRLSPLDDERRRRRCSTGCCPASCRQRPARPARVSRRRQSRVRRGDRAFTHRLRRGDAVVRRLVQADRRSRHDGDPELGGRARRSPDGSGRDERRASRCRMRR